MKDSFDYAYDYGDYPLGYLITIRSYGTWLHGDKEWYVDRHGFNIYGTPKRPRNRNLANAMRANLKHPPVIFNHEQRAAIEEAVREVCENRGYVLHAVNARSNHLHTVVFAPLKPEPVRNAFKSYATRKLRERGLLGDEIRPWARRGSRRYLWKAQYLAQAVHYTRYGQGDVVPALGDFSDPGDEWD